VLLAAVLAFGGCGGGSAKPPCQQDSLGSLDSAVAAEAAILERGRADADFGHAFGADSQRLIDAADASRAAMFQQVAAARGVALPAIGMPTTTCSTGSATLKRGAILSLTAPALIFASGMLGLAASGVPVSGMTPDVPMVKTENGTASDGSPTQTTTTIDATLGGHDSTAVAMVTMSSTINAGGKWTTESITISMSVNVCPDAGGVAPGTVVLSAAGAVGSGDTASSTYHVDINDQFSYQVNDSAAVTATVDTSSVMYTATGGRDASANVRSTVTVGSGPSPASPDTVDEEDGSAETAALMRKCLYTFGIYTATVVQDVATGKWQGGTCVEVHVDPGSEMVDKNAQVTVTAQPYHKFDKANLNTKVVATLSGVQSLSPQSQPTAPAMFTYVAGTKFKDSGTVNLKSTSKRGIATASATYTVKCDDTMMCPAGRKLNLQTCMCECEMMQTCPAGSVWDDQSCMCVCAPKACPGNQTWDSQTCQCVCGVQTCPPGKTLNTELCECETICQLDPTSGFPPPTCVWVGTAHVSASGSGTLDNSMNDRVTWSLSYDASLSVSEQGATQAHNLAGSVTGQYTEIEVISSPQCTSTLKSDFSISKAVDRGTLAVLPQGNGTHMIYIDVGMTYEGPFTVTGTGDCGPDSTDMSGIGFGNFFGYGTASGSTFSGSTDDAAPSDLTFPNGEPAKYRLAWSMRLVQR
jgi:hypothetical protein